MLRTSASFACGPFISNSHNNTSICYLHDQYPHKFTTRVASYSLLQPVSYRDEYSIMYTYPDRVVAQEYRRLLQQLAACYASLAVRWNFRSGSARGIKG